VSGRDNDTAVKASFGAWFELQVAAATGLVWCLGRSLRVTWHGNERLEEARRRAQGCGVIYAFWHQRLLPFCFTHRRQNINVLVSTHRDGELIARVIANMGFDTVRGSSTRGGREAVREMATDKRKQFDLAVTPDGPRGPARTLKPGLLVLARRTRRPIVPIANAVWPRFELSSWDKFHIPLPFAACSIVHGEPWWPERGVDSDTAQTDLENRINNVTREAERLVRGTVEVGDRG
jgi:lysophospholipid acyltransferase (LPLAT)-like uncharacterized protein